MLHWIVIQLLKTKNNFLFASPEDMIGQISSELQKTVNKLSNKVF